MNAIGSREIVGDVMHIARQIFQNKSFFFSLPGEVFLIKKRKKVSMKNLPGASNSYCYRHDLRMCMIVLHGGY
jgi:hypothetical protein